jgi:hypothetical protein
MKKTGPPSSRRSKEGEKHKAKNEARTIHGVGWLGRKAMTPGPVSNWGITMKQKPTVKSIGFAN